MLTTEGVVIEIHVQTEEDSNKYVQLEEYDDPEDEVDTNGTERIKVKYIEAKPDRKFQIHTKYPKGFVLHGADRLRTRFSLDSNNGKESLARFHQRYDKLSRDLLVVTCDIRKKIQDNIYDVEFCFGSTVKDVKDPGEGVTQRTDLVGAIRVHWERRETMGHAKRPQAYKELQQQHSLTKKQLVSGIDHNITFEHRKPVAASSSTRQTKNVDPAGGEITAEFRYRSRDTLIRMGCIPPNQERTSGSETVTQPIPAPIPQYLTHIIAVNRPRVASPSTRPTEALVTQQLAPPTSGIDQGQESDIEQLRRENAIQAAEIARLKEAMNVLLGTPQSSAQTTSSQEGPGLPHIKTESSIPVNVKREAANVIEDRGSDTTTPRASKRSKTGRREIIELD